MLVPTVALLALVAVVYFGTSAAMIIQHPNRIAQASPFILKLARTAYQRTRTDWQTLASCAVFDPELLYRPRPGSCAFRNSEFATMIHFGDDGSRVTFAPRTPPGSASRPRLVVIGDSHAMGWGVADDETFASVLAAEYGYPTVNLGVSSYATPRELRRLERDFVLRPDDIIVMQYSDNDLPENHHFLVSGRRSYQRADLESLQAHHPTSAEALPVAGILLRRFARDAAERLDSFVSFAGSAPDEDDAGRTSAATLIGVLERFPAVRDNPLLVVAINGRPNRTHLSIDAEAFRPAGIVLVVPELTDEDFFALDDHMRRQGHRAVAAAIAAALTTYRLDDTRQSAAR